MELLHGCVNLQIMTAIFTYHICIWYVEQVIVNQNQEMDVLSNQVTPQHHYEGKYEGTERQTHTEALIKHLKD